MSYFVVGVILPADIATEDVENAVSRALAPYDVNVEVEPYPSYLSDDSIARMKKHFGIESNDPLDLVPYVERWTGCAGAVDEKGLYSLSTYNPKSRWDWYEIGGRWSGYLTDGNGDVCRVSEIRIENPPYAIVAADGTWHQEADMGWFGRPRYPKDDEYRAIEAELETAKDDDERDAIRERLNAIVDRMAAERRRAWTAEAMDLLVRHREPVDHLIVCVDCHI